MPRVDNGGVMSLVTKPAIHVAFSDAAAGSRACPSAAMAANDVGCVPASFGGEPLCPFRDVKHVRKREPNWAA
jgi:hypothetical protein